LGPPPDERSSLWPDGRIFHSTPPSK
jgi:hypothetical protein